MLFFLRNQDPDLHKEIEDFRGTLPEDKRGKFTDLIAVSFLIGQQCQDKKWVRKLVWSEEQE
jgi:hypothetical protein